jgi:protein TonB
LLAIVLLHIAAGWLMLQLPALREAAEQAAPLMVSVVSAERPLPAAEPLPQPRALHAPLPPVLAVPTVEWTPAAPVAAPVGPVTPIAEALAPAPQPTPRAPPPAAEKQIAITEVAYLSPPVLLYPLAARRSREEGLVQVQVRVDEQGRPERFVIVRSSGHARLDEAALQTVRATRFKPYTENGSPLPFWVVMPLLFDLDNH